MATLKVVANLLECDGCKAVTGLPHGYDSPTEARAAAYAAGWRFPSHTTKSGTRPASTTSDVCPACAPGWTPQPRASRARQITGAELAALRGAP